MSKEANVKQIGIFVVGALVIFTVAVVVMMSGKFFKQKLDYALYFEEPLDGLTDGSPVTFKGVQIGEVTDISIYYNHSDKSLQSAVIIEIDPERIKRIDNGRKLIADPAQITPYIKEGLKAKLKLQSLITGQLSVMLDFFPDEPAVMHNYLKQYQEIPTVETQMAEVRDILQHLPLKEITQKLLKTVSKIEKFMDSPETEENIKALVDTGKSAHDLITKMDSNLDPMLKDIRETTAATRSLLDQAQKTLALNEGVPGQLAAKIQTTLDKVDKNLDNLDNLAKDNRDITYQLQNTINEFNKVAKSARELTDYLEQHPEALIRGKKEPKGESK
jgi:paraquat-inducible protein B